MINYLLWLGIIVITVLAVLLLAIAIFSFYYVVTGKGMKKDAEDSSHS
jgi:uncharacterized membrane protein